MPRLAPRRGWKGILTVLAMGTISSIFLLLWWSLLPRGTVETDVAYYYAHLHKVRFGEFQGALPEYPLPGAVLLWIPTLVVSTYDAYFNVFWIASLLIVGAIASILYSGAPTAARGVRTAGIWLLLVTAAGPLTLFRFDLWPAMCLAVALVAFRANRWASWSMWLTTGAAIKLWPIVVWPLGFAATGNRPGPNTPKSLSSTQRKLLFAFGATFLVWALVSVLAGGTTRALSPFTWQGERGLHVESTFALWILWARVFVSEDAWPAELSSNNSVDFTGPGVETTLLVGTVFTIVFAVMTGLLCWRLYRAPSGRKQVVNAAAAILLLLLLVNKVFSPQYIIWAIPAVALALARESEPTARVTAMVAATFITGLSYPTLYGLLFSGNSADMVVGAVVLTLRAGALTWLAAHFGVRAWVGGARYNRVDRPGLPKLGVLTEHQEQR